MYCLRLLHLSLNLLIYNYAALSRSLQHEWTFLQCVVPQCGQLFQKLDLSLFSCFLPAMFGVFLLLLINGHCNYK